MTRQINSIVIGGLAATAVMTVLMLTAPLMGLPKMPIGNMLAGFLGISLALGWVMHFVIGTLLAAGYVLLLRDRLPGSNLVKGALYSLIPFLLAQTVVMPMMGMGFFSSHAPQVPLLVMGSLAGHLVYGAVLGLTAKKPQENRLNTKSSCFSCH
ncbi:MAG: hypothetical protein Kow00100_18400 [Geothermobacteraceae bacterium]